MRSQEFLETRGAEVAGPRPDKVAAVDEVKEHLEQADAAILTEYRGLKVADLATLRRELRSAGAEYKIFKNTLVRRATADAGASAIDPLLEGPTAIAFVKADVAAVAKVLRDFARTNPALVVKGSLVGGNLLDASSTGRLADLPSREVLLAQLAGALAAPLRQMAGLLKALPQNLAYGLSALADQKRAAGDTSEQTDAASQAAEVSEEPAEADEDAGEQAAEPAGEQATEAADDSPGAPAEEAEAEPSEQAEAEPAGEAEAEAAPAEQAEAEQAEQATAAEDQEPAPEEPASSGDGAES
jgi:large subunit ribosomal protein L10